LERSASLVQDAESGVVRKIPKKSATHITMRILMQAFTMTFLAEWGDRSQLTTIILAASKNVYGVITGGIIGHSICTGLAVIGGRMVAAKISVRTVTILGGIVFIGFAVYALIVKPDDI
ncbi:transmembrane protein 165-like, partial [Rhagoletis pomonella]